MAGVKISQLTPGGAIQSVDELPISRAGIETYKILASQIVTDGANVGGGSAQIFADRVTADSTTLRFRSLSGDEGINFRNVDGTIVVSTSGQNPIKTKFFGNGSTLTFPINGNFSVNPNNYRVDIDGVLQEPIADYNVVGSNIIFTSAPPLSSKVVVVANNIIPAYDIMPSDGSVTSNKIALSAVTQDKIAPITATGTLSARTLQDRFADVTYVKDFGAVGGLGQNATTESNALQAAINSARRTLPNDYILPMHTVDLQGETYLIDRPLVINQHPFTRFINGALSAVGPIWNTSSTPLTAYMLNCTGVNALANMGLEIDLSLFCNARAAGIYLQNAYRSRINPRVNKMSVVGIYIASAVGLSKIEGIYHEREAGDPNFTTDDRSATGIWIGPQGGDIYVSAAVGWTHRCIYNESIGPVHFNDCHVYCSSTSTPILGTIYEHASGADGIMSQCYLDTGRFIYRGGRLHVDSDCRFFHLTPVTPPQLSAYIEMVASAPNQFHLLTIDAPYRSDRTKPLVNLVQTGGNSWFNVPFSLGQPNRDCFTRLDPIVISTADNNQRPLVLDNKAAICTTEYRDNGTTFGQPGPQFGSRGNAAIITAGGSDRLSLSATGIAIDYTILPDYADDVAAATAGHAVGRMYRTGSTIKVRVS